MFRLVFLFLILMSITDSAVAQITVTEDAGIRNLMDRRKELNFKKDRYIKAWSIQIMVSRDKYEVLEKKEAFEKEYDDYKVDWTYEQPNYKLNVGAYYTKLEATMAMHKLLEDYPDAYVFKNNQAKASDF
jgi:hypothetical protein